jgi:hypothetical protein
MSLLLEKKCSKCKLLLPFSEFYKNRCHPSGYHNHCKACFRVTSKQNTVKKQTENFDWEDYLLDNRERFEPRFWNRANKPEVGCWTWKGCTNSRGYGQFAIKGRVKSSHRVAYVLTYGKIGDRELCVCHRCDTPPCIRPDHLFLGTHKDNLADCAKKGRLNHRIPVRGETCGAAKLTTQNVIEIYELRSKKVRVVEIAQAYSVKPATIYAIFRGDNWKHLK